MNKNIILVLGHTGFIGHHVSEHFFRRGYDVYGYSQSSGLSNLISEGNWLLIECIHKTTNLYNIFRHLSPILCINCAGRKKNLCEMIDSNIDLVSHVCSSLKKYVKSSNNAINFIHISSMGVESPYIRCGKYSLNKYELTKKSAESVISASLYSNNKLSYSILRPSIVLSRKSRFISRLRLLYLLFPIQLQSSDFVIPYVYIDDLAEVIYNCFLENLNHINNRVVTISNFATLTSLHVSYKSSSYLYKNLCYLKLPYSILLQLISKLGISYFIPCKPLSLPIDRYIHLTQATTTTLNLSSKLCL